MCNRSRLFDPSLIAADPTGMLACMYRLAFDPHSRSGIDLLNSEDDNFLEVWGRLCIMALQGSTLLPKKFCDDIITANRNAHTIDLQNKNKMNEELRSHYRQVTKLFCMIALRCHPRVTQPRNTSNDRTRRMLDYA